MKQEIQFFDFNEAPVRVHLGERGEPWFVAADVCRVLELGNPTEALRALDDDERNTLSNPEGIQTAPGNPTFNVINESGLYNLIFRSRKPAAKSFKRWVTHEVLPALRQSGRYEIEPVIEPASLADRKLGSIIEVLDTAIHMKAAGLLSNDDAAGISGLCCQYFKALELRTRTTHRQRGRFLARLMETPAPNAA